MLGHGTGRAAIVTHHVQRGHNKKLPKVESESARLSERGAYEGRKCWLVAAFLLETSFGLNGLTTSLEFRNQLLNRDAKFCRQNCQCLFRNALAMKRILQESQRLFPQKAEQASRPNLKIGQACFVRDCANVVLKAHFSAGVPRGQRKTIQGLKRCYEVTGKSSAFAVLLPW